MFCDVSCEEGMYQKIITKLQKTQYSIDTFQYKENILKIKGWIFSEKHIIEDVSIILIENGIRRDLFADANLERIDVYGFYNRFAPSKNCGFHTMVRVHGVLEGKVWLEYKKKGKKCRLFLGTIHGEKADEVLIQPWSWTQDSLKVFEFEKKNLNDKLSFDVDTNVEIDIVVPVYNGYQYLEPLFTTMQRTKMKYRLIIINDCSPDERVTTYLKFYCENNSNAMLIENDTNLGFVKSVNKGLKETNNHVVLVNTDVEMPECWLERLIWPILEDESIASATPYTNAGTICSFPEIGKDNKIFFDLPLKAVDDHFKIIKPRYTEMPTGVGFCMAMSRKALDSVGLLDEVNFGMGYGEENDWCQRAIKCGMKNVHVENLYVYHKHGGSFLSEDKKRYIRENAKILAKKYPTYNQDVEDYFDKDNNKDVRKYVELKLLLDMNIQKTLVFNHSLGGGATSYLKKKEQEILASDEAYCLVTYDYDTGKIKADYKYKNNIVNIDLESVASIAEFLKLIMPDVIVINELVLYPKLYNILGILKMYKMQNKVHLSLLLHDYYSVCPTVTLLNEQDVYCRIPELEYCEKCLKCNKEIRYLEYGSMKEWRNNWLEFAKCCDEIVAFSNDSKKIFEKAYGKTDNIKIVPHTIEYLPTINKKGKHTKTLNIGLLGALNKHKGIDIVGNVLEYIEQNGLNINIIVIGTSSKKFRSKHFIETGKYTREMLPQLVLEQDIDIFWMSSICPETFSYTTEEVMTMNMPIMSFDLGAPAERIKKYEKGYIIPSMKEKDVVRTAKEWYEKNQFQHIDKEEIFVDN